jgi:hypothetical protein
VIYTCGIHSGRAEKGRKFPEHNPKPGDWKV